MTDNIEPNIQQSLCLNDELEKNLQSHVVSVVECSIKFRTFAVVDERFTGKGTLKINDEYLEICGRARRKFSIKRVKEQFKLSSICNVVVSGTLIRFAVPVEEEIWHAVVVCPSENIAQQVVSLLPSTIDSDLFSAEDAQHEFEKKLEQLSPITPISYTILAINLMMFLTVALYDGQLLNLHPARLVAFGGNYSPLTTEGEWWRMLTAVFLHGGVIHLAFNMYALFSFGRLAERVYGTWTFLAIYLLSGVAGATGTLLSKPVVGVGASGAIFGVIGALLAFLFIDREFLQVPVRRQLQKKFAVFTCYALFYGLSKAGIDNSAHFGGFFCGLILGLAIGEPTHVSPQNSRKSGWRVATSFFCTALIILTAIFYSPRPGYDYAVIYSLNQITIKLTELERNTDSFNKSLAEKTTDEASSASKVYYDQMLKQLETYDIALLAINTYSARAADLKNSIHKCITLRVDGIKLKDLAAVMNNKNWTTEAMQKYLESQKIMAELSKSI